MPPCQFHTQGRPRCSRKRRSFNAAPGIELRAIGAATISTLRSFHIDQDERLRRDRRGRRFRGRRDHPPPPPAVRFSATVNSCRRGEEILPLCSLDWLLVSGERAVAAVAAVARRSRHRFLLVSRGRAKLQIHPCSYGRSSRQSVVGVLQNGKSVSKSPRGWRLAVDFTYHFPNDEPHNLPRRGSRTPTRKY